MRSEPFNYPMTNQNNALKRESILNLISNIVIGLNRSSPIRLSREHTEIDFQSLRGEGKINFMKSLINYSSRVEFQIQKKSNIFMLFVLLNN